MKGGSLMSSGRKPLKKITITESLQATCEITRKHLYTKADFITTISRYLKNKVSEKTIIRWVNGSNVPRASNFSAEHMKGLIELLLERMYKNKEEAMVSDYCGVLDTQFNFDIQELNIIVDPQQKFNRLISILTDTAFREQNDDKIIIVKQQYINADPRDLLKEVFLSIRVPEVSFPVQYYLRHVQNGKNEFLPENDRLPLNRDYEFQKTASNNIYTVQIPSVTPQIGFQFKCFAKCEERYASSLASALKAHFKYSSAKFREHLDESAQYYQDHWGRKFPLVDFSSSNSGKVWFLLPDYSVYITFDPYINNFCGKTKSDSLKA